MAKNKTILINRKLFDRIRRMDHCQMSLWAESVYKSGFKDGSAAAEGLTVDEMKTAILGIKGIGEKRAADIAAALSLALENKGKAGGEK